MNLATLIFILIIYGGLLYSLYYSAARKIAAEQKTIKNALLRRIRHLNSQIKSLETVVSNLKVSGDKTNDEVKSAKSQNPLARMEERYVAEINAAEIVMVNGNPVRKAQAFKTN
ncbi:MAG: hypothetical protein H0X49_03390 [Acidobacteria bacterium]|nr:hypothetical protein [Acidobacteriota bacterium]